MSAQIIFGGKTSRVHPDAPPPDWCLYSHSENHWTSLTTLQEICQFMSDKVHGKKFVILMDLCPVHCCRDFLDWSHEALPNMLLAFVPPGMTAQLQPLDRAYMRTVKNEIRKAAAQSLAHDVISAHRNGAILQLDMRMPALRPRLVNWVTTARDATVARPEICELAWRQLTLSPIQYAAVYKEACAHHDEGTLFHKIEPYPLEAECKDEEGDEINLRSWNGAARARLGRSSHRGGDRRTAALTVPRGQGAASLQHFESLIRLIREQRTSLAANHKVIPFPISFCCVKGFAVERLQPKTRAKQCGT